MNRRIHKTVDEHLPEQVLQPFKELVAQVSGARQVRGLNQKELSKLSGVGESTVNRYEAFKANVAVSTIMQLLDAMDLKLAIVPKDIDMETVRTVNTLLIKYSQIMKGHLSE